MTLRNLTIKHILLSSGAISIVIGGIFVYFLRRRRKPQYSKPVILCNDASDWIKKKKEFLKQFQSAKFIGLDCEWVTGNYKRHPVALLQLATADGLIVLVRLCNMKVGSIPYTLMQLLADEKIVKVGVGVCEDAHKLLYDYGLIVESCFDLRHFAKDRLEFQGKCNLSLNNISQAVLKRGLNKNPALTCSNWESTKLTSKQVAYAAEDALAGAKIFEKNLLPYLKRWPNGLVYDLKIIQPYLNIPFKQTASLSSNCELPKDSGKMKPLKPDRRLYSKLPVSKLLYENCQLLAPDGEQLCSCDAKKALWYVNKGRGEIINNKPLTVRLNFEPSGRPILDNKYYIQEKENCCVVCGATELLIRKFIVPSEYRKHFPTLMKKSLSHDVLLLCFPCHRKSNTFNDKLRAELAVECDAPIGSELNAEMKVNSELFKVKSAAKALFNFQDKIPEKRQLELKKVLSYHFQVEDVTEDLIEEASNLNCFYENDKFVIHGLKVYEHMCKNEGLIALETRWRKNFLKTMKPQFLPKLWSVDHNHERLALQVLKNKPDFDISILGLSDELMERVKQLNL